MNSLGVHHPTGPKFPSASVRRGFASLLAPALALILAAPAAASPATELSESFSGDPWIRGWRTAGDASLFRWNSASGAMEVTWDSSRSNSFFFRPLGTVLTRAESFQFTFALRLTDLRLGSTPGKSAEFPIAIGLINQTMTTNANVYRGAGTSGTYGVRNLVEWDFYGDAGFGDTWATTVVSSNNVFSYGHSFPVPLVPGDLYRITLAYSASNQLLRTSASRNGQPVGELETVSIAGRPDFRLDAVSVTSYSDAIQVGSPVFHGSVLAHAILDDLALTLPPPPVEQLSLQVEASGLAASFVAPSKWVHRLERSFDLGGDAWHVASAWVPGDGSRLTLLDTNTAGRNAVFYRIRSERP